VPIAKAQPRRLIAVAALIQLAAFIVQYLTIFSAGQLNLSAISWTIDSWLFFPWTIYFALGLVFGFHLDRIRPVLRRIRWYLLGAMVLLAIPASIEAEAIYWSTGYDDRFVPFTISTILYSLVFIMVFLILEEVRIPFAAKVQQVGSKSYGIYLTHIKVMEFVARVLRQVTPWLLAYQVLLFSPIILVLGLGIPIVFMNLVSKSPARRYYHYLFG
jgi:membrane-bound acyltransferase YfiQ involved in biofilm formation